MSYALELRAFQASDEKKARDFAVNIREEDMPKVGLEPTWEVNPARF